MFLKVYFKSKAQKLESVTEFSGRICFTNHLSCGIINFFYDFAQVELQ